MGNRNCLIGFPNRIDQATLSGGSWLAARPLTKLQNSALGDVARSTNAALASTKIDVDMMKLANIKLIDIRNHNLTLQAKYRITASNDAGFAALVHDSGWLMAWPVVYPVGTVDWEEDSFWSGQYSDEQRRGYMPAVTRVLPVNVLARYWRIEFDDAANPAGYVQVGRLFVGPAWQPEQNMSRNASIGWETTTEVQEAYSGSEFFDVKTPRRIARFALDWMDEAEGMSKAFELQRQAGVDKEVIWVHDPTDTVHALRRQFMGRLSQLSPVEFPYATVTRTAFEIKEKI